ncbi:MAG TPA: hypothetical protein VF286_11580 [Acidiphilium sp.]
MAMKTTLMAAVAAATLMATGTALAAGGAGPQGHIVRVAPQATQTAPRIAQLSPQMEALATSGNAVTFGSSSNAGAPQWVQTTHTPYPSFAPRWKLR